MLIIAEGVRLELLPKLSVTSEQDAKAILSFIFDYLPAGTATLVIDGILDVLRHS